MDNKFKWFILTLVILFVATCCYKASAEEGYMIVDGNYIELEGSDGFMSIVDEPGRHGLNGKIIYPKKGKANYKKMYLDLINNINKKLIDSNESEQKSEITEADVSDKEHVFGKGSNDRKLGACYGEVGETVVIASPKVIDYNRKNTVRRW